MQGSEFLQYVWSLQPAGWRFLCWRVDGGWKELPIGMVRHPEAKPKLGKEVLNKGDLYFCPNSFRADDDGIGRRRKQLCLPSRVMYQDLDESDPRDLALEPELWWETSPGRYQALWILDRHVEPLEFAQLNKALNRACFADPGTWNLTRYLRVPGSWNQKRGCRVSRAYQVMEAAA